MSKYNGFTLIEVAISLAIIGYLIGGLLGPMALIADYKKLNNTDATLEQIKEALVGFSIIHNRLPCPARCTKYKEQCVKGTYDSDDIGKEDTALCKKEGFLPWADLGVGRYDAWHRPFYYRVDKNYSATKITSSLKTDSSNKLKVISKQTGNNLTPFETTSEKKYSRVIAIIFSRGQNDKAESSNKYIDSTYMQGDYISDESNYFDDRLTWLSKYTVTNYLTTSRDLPQ